MAEEEQAAGRRNKEQALCKLEPSSTRRRSVQRRWAQGKPRGDHGSAGGWEAEKIQKEVATMNAEIQAVMPKVRANAVAVYAQANGQLGADDYEGLKTSLEELKTIGRHHQPRQQARQRATKRSGPNYGRDARGGEERQARD